MRERDFDIPGQERFEGGNSPGEGKVRKQVREAGVRLEPTDELLQVRLEVQLAVKGDAPAEVRIGRNRRPRLELALCWRRGRECCDFRNSDGRCRSGCGADSRRFFSISSRSCGRAYAGRWQSPRHHCGRRPRTRSSPSRTPVLSVCATSVAQGPVAARNWAVHVSTDEDAAGLSGRSCSWSPRGP